MFQVTHETIAELIDDEPALNTLKTVDADEIWALLDDKASITDRDELFEALMGVMHSTRPKGFL